MPPVANKPTAELIVIRRTAWGGAQLKTTGIHEPTTGPRSSVDADRLPSSVEVDILDIHVVRKLTTEIEKLVEVWFSIALCDVGGIFETFDGVRFVSVEDSIVQAGSSVRCNKPEIVELLLVFLTRLELGVEQVLAGSVQGCQTGASKSESREDGAEVHDCRLLLFESSMNV